MPRMRQISAAQEREELFASLKSASVVYLKTRFLVHERVETEAMKAFRSSKPPPPPRDYSPVEDEEETENECCEEIELDAEEADEESVDEAYIALAKAEGIEPCPCCGSWCSHLVETLDDLEVLISVDSRQRWNRWENRTEEDNARFNEIKAKAVPYGTENAEVWEVVIDFTCSRKAMAQIKDSKTRVCYWSGGWRSSKSHTAAQWWLRGWVRYGSRGELFWLVGPELKVAYRLMTRLFMGRGETDARGWQRGRSIAPKYFDPDLKAWRSCVARSLPAHEKVQLMQFEMVDGSIIELRHTKSANSLEGDTVRRILFDEAIRSNGDEGYKVLLSRVAQGGGQLGIASIPGIDDRSRWLFEQVVQPAESGTARDKKVYTTPTYSNLWIPHYEAKAMEESYGDDTETIDYGIYGKWGKSDGMAYTGYWQPEYAPRTILNAHTPEAWGFTHDVTSLAAQRLFGVEGAKCEYLGGRDWNWTQVGIICKVFSNNPTDRSTWTLVVLDEHIAKGDAAKAAYDFTSIFRSGKYKGKIGLIVDCNGFEPNHQYSGKKSATTDAYEFEVRGCLVAASWYTDKKRARPGARKSGDAPQNPKGSDSKKLNRILMSQKRIMVDGGECKNIVTALPQVKDFGKRKQDSGTRYDKTIANWDECLRYLTWALFHDELPGPKPTKKVFRTNFSRVG